MDYFLARGSRQLDLCLRILYDAGIPNPYVETVKNEKGKIEYHIGIDTDEQAYERLKERYNNVIS